MLDDGRTESREEAWALMDESARICYMLDVARNTAEAMLRENGNTPITTRDVCRQMIEDGTYRKVGSTDRWMGKIFADARFNVVEGVYYTLTQTDFAETNNRRGKCSHSGARISFWVLRPATTDVQATA